MKIILLTIFVFNTAVAEGVGSFANLLSQSNESLKDSLECSGVAIEDKPEVLIKSEEKE